MLFPREFYRCNKCGNLTVKVHNGGGTLSCCGAEMEHLKPNTQEGAAEKHLPVARHNGDVLEVKVGSVLHPQTPEHHIEFIVMAQDQYTTWSHLNPEEIPEAVFDLASGSVTLYAYCNLHGLWATDVPDGLDLEGEVCSAEFTEGCTNVYEG